MQQTVSSSMEAAKQVLRTASLRDHYTELGNTRQRSIESELILRKNKLQEKLNAASQDYHSIIQLTQQTTSRVSHAERQLVNLTAEIDRLHRLRLAQMNVLQKTTNHCAVVGRQHARAVAQLNEGQLQLKQIDAQRYDAENSYTSIVEETKKIEQDYISLTTAIRHRKVDFSRSTQTFKNGTKKLQEIQQKYSIIVQETEKVKANQLRMESAIQNQLLNLKQSKKKLKAGKLDLDEIKEAVIEKKTEHVKNIASAKQLQKNLEALAIALRQQNVEFDQATKNEEMGRKKLLTIQNSAPLPVKRKRVVSKVKGEMAGNVLKKPNTSKQKSIGKKIAGTKTSTKSKTMTKKKTRRRRRQIDNNVDNAKFPQRTTSMFGRL